MAFCPQCRGELEATAAACPHCGYDFPLRDPELLRPPAPGIAYSRFADVSLVVGIVAAGLGCVVTGVGAVVALGRGNLWDGLVVAPFQFFVLFALLVVFVRVQRIGPRHERGRVR